MEIAALEAARHDSLSVQIKATNTGSVPVIWDNEFATLITWEIQTDSRKIVHPEFGESLDRPQNPLSPDRFVTLQPGQSVSKTIDLSGGFRTFRTGHGSIVSPEGVAHVPMAWESQAKIEIPQGTKSVRIIARYSSRNIDDLGGDNFQSYFGRSLNETRIPQGPVESGMLTIKLSH